MHYDLEIPCWLTCDSSPHGLGFVLNHKVENGRYDPIVFGSKNPVYSGTILRPIVKPWRFSWVVKTFHKLLHERPFPTYTELRPFYDCSITGSLLRQYCPHVLCVGTCFCRNTTELVYRSRRQMGKADMFIRLPLPVKHSGGKHIADVFC